METFVRLQNEEVKQMPSNGCRIMFDGHVSHRRLENSRGNNVDTQQEALLFLALLIIRYEIICLNRE